MGDDFATTAVVDGFVFILLAEEESIERGEMMAAALLYGRSRKKLARLNKVEFHRGSMRQGGAPGENLGGP